jgi:uncharacterized protein YcbK (DUF882 family)
MTGIGVLSGDRANVLSRIARTARGALRPRACLRLGVASSLLLLGGLSSVKDATATGDTRTLSFHHTHSGENLTVTFKRNGRYDEAALKDLNYFLRDWRSQDQTVMDRHLFDILWEVYRDVDGKQPIQIISSYRSPATNSMLRRRSAHSGVARSSQHMLGKAMDFFIPGVPLEQIRFAGLRLQRGGVGFYPTSGSPFVHLDTGNVRHWPRMTRDQLVRVFPNGRTVHVPTDGNPLPGYEIALAEVQKRKSGDDSGGKPSFLASLFRGKQAAPASDDDDEAGPSVAKPAPAALVASVEATAAAENVPLPRAKPVTYQVAAAGSTIVPAPQAAPARAESRADAKTDVKADARADTKAEKPRFETPADIINARGFWGDAPATPKQASPEQVAALAARNAFAAMDPQATASIERGREDKAMAYAAVAPIDRSRIVAASAPLPRLRHAAPPARPMGPEITTIVTKGQQGRPATVTTAARIAPARNANSAWLRAMIMAPSASQAMLATSFGDIDLTGMRQLFVKPAVTVTMTFADDPQLGLVTERFSGSALATVATTSFTRTAALR